MSSVKSFFYMEQVLLVVCFCTFVFIVSNLTRSNFRNLLELPLDRLFLLRPTSPILSSTLYFKRLLISGVEVFSLKLRP